MDKKNIESIYPLSPTQQGILFHTLSAPESGVYIVQSCYTFSDKINITAFQQAWQQVINHHPILRTSFHWKQHKEPFQVVHKSIELPWYEYDWQRLSVTEQPEKLTAFLAADRQQGFNISQPSLLRLTFIQIAQETYHFIWSSHHLILDGWSAALVLNQVFRAYEALCQGQVLGLPRCRPYQHYIAWLQQQNLAEAEAFWRKLLKGFTAPTQLRINNFSHTAIGSQEESIKLSPTTTTALQSLARQHKLTLNTLVQGIWSILLSRYSGEEDIVFGATSAGRPPALTGSESMVGLFINTLPVRVQISGNELLIPWLQKLQVQQVETQQYEYSPLVQVQGWSEVPRDLPLFETILVFENYPVDAALKAKATEMQIHEIRSAESTNYPITFSVEVSTELKLEILYDGDRFDAPMIKRMLGHLRTLLESIVSNPHQSLSSLPLLTTAEIHQQLLEWNNTQIEYPQDKCIHQLFEQQVEKTPDAVAVVFAQQQLTYRKLNQRANQLAHYLQKLGVSRDVLVGICLDRSLEMIIAVLGVFKAGGAYVPLDPNLPIQRLAFMVEDADCQVILTQTNLRDNFFIERENVVCLDADLQLILPESESNLPNDTVAPENLAYLIYTSGSTGQAKGVMVEHKSLTNAYFGWEEAYKLRSLVHCHLQMASFSFDVFIGDLSRALCSGGKLVLCPRDFLLEPQQLYAYICEHQVDCAEFVPAVLSNLIQYLETTQQRLEFMRLVICGSDSWYGSEYRKYQKFFSKETRLINSFGVTEATIDSCYFESTAGEFSTQQLVPIGRPFPNIKLYILDAYFHPVPIGVCGELYISGVGLARGYHHLPELTKEKFIPHIFSQEADARLYKTGDLAYYQPDGNIVFVGRTDNQVKIRGFRIELGEIEAVLAKHPDVQQTVAITQDNSLVAYVVTSSKKQLISDELRNFLKQQMPYYMVPNTFVFLESLPLTPNGKVNRKALTAINPVAQASEKVFLEPRTPLEQKLVNIWREILNIEKISIDDNFFDLGGHSLLIVQLSVRIRAAFKVDLSLQTLLAAPTIEALAAQLEIVREQKSSTVTIKHPSLNLKAEVFLDSKITAQGKIIDYKEEPASVFLTGATGFLGAFLLDELLQQTQADIYCLVRAANADEGKQKIRRTLESYLIWNESYSCRIIPVVGNLSQPLLGLSETQFASLAKKLDVIYHNGAYVHHAFPYSTLKAANVLGTQEIFRLASQTKIKPVHFISTVSVFSPPVDAGVQLISEQSNLDDFTIPEGGYSQSKWVGEKLVTIARDRGLPVCIYRLGRVSGHSTTGVFNSNDFFYRLLMGCIQLGSAPDVDYAEDLAPVDYVSKAIVYLSQQQESLNKVFHLLNPQLLDLKLLFNVITAFGYPLQQISLEEWQKQLINIAENCPEHPLYALVPFFSAPASAAPAAGIQFDCQNTIAALVSKSILCPSVDQKLISTYIAYLIQSGHLNPPQTIRNVESNAC